MAFWHFRKDIADRAANCCWHWLLKQTTGLSNDAMDESFVLLRDRASGRLKCFYRIQGMGTSPKETRGYLKKQTIFETVHELPGLLDFDAIHALAVPPRYPEACHLLVSPLWEILTCRDISVARLNAIIDSLLRVYKRERFMAWQLGVLERTKAGLGKTLQEGLSISDEDLLGPLRNACDVDSLALVIALYKVAIANVELELALQLHGVVLDVVANFAKTWQFDWLLDNLLVQLVIDRGLHNIWLTEKDWVKQTNRMLLRATKEKRVTESQRKRELVEFIQWYINRPVDPSLSFERVGLPLSKERYDKIVNDYLNYDIPQE